MLTTYRVRMSDGSVVTCTTLDEVQALVLAEPHAQVEPVVHYRPCPLHRAYESANCPLCGPLDDEFTPPQPD